MFFEVDTILTRIETKGLKWTTEVVIVKDKNHHFTF